MRRCFSLLILAMGAGCMAIPDLAAVNPCDPLYDGPYRCASSQQDAYLEPDSWLPETDAEIDLPDAWQDEPDTNDSDLGDIVEIDAWEPEPDTDSGSEPDAQEPDAWIPEPDADASDPPDAQEPECDCVDDGLACTVQWCSNGWDCDLDVLDGFRLGPGGCEVPVAGIALPAAALTLRVGQQVLLEAVIEPGDATDRRVAWASERPSIAAIANGVVTAAAPGSAHVTATSIDGGFVAECSITVLAPVHIPVASVAITPPQQSVDVGRQVAFAAAVAPADATDPRVAWAVEPPWLAAISDGIVTGMAPGTCHVLATSVDGGIVATADLEVIQRAEGLVLSQSSIEITAGDSFNLQAQVLPIAASDKRVAWSSDNPLVATVADGTVSGVGVGAAIIQAVSIDGGFAAACTAMVTAPPTWIDLAAGLEWQRNSAVKLSLAQATQYCAGLELSGGGWRLPRLDELKGVVVGCGETETCNLDDDGCAQYLCRSPSCNGCAMGCYMNSELGGACDWEWSTLRRAPGWTWAVDFKAGVVWDLPEQDLRNFRCVRNHQ